MGRFLAGETMAIDDVRDDPRTNAEQEGWRALGVRAVVNLPVSEHGRVVGMLIVHHEAPHHWTADEMAFLRGAGDRLEIAIAQRRAEERQDVLNGEIAHRLKNTLAMVQGVAMQTLRGDASPDGLDGFARRLQALGAAHDALTSGRSEAAALDHVLGTVLEAAGVDDRCRRRGPPVQMGARAALACSLLIHELTTNAVKHGALSAEGGSVEIMWRIISDGEPMVVLDWTETGGPPATAPTRRGFGSRLIRLGLVGTGGSDVRYEATGLAAEFRAPLTEVEQA